MTAASNSESRKRLAASAAVESVLSQHERDVLIEASHPSRPDREALLVAAAERFLAARIEQARAEEGALREALSAQRQAIVSRIEDAALAVMSDVSTDKDGAPLVAAVLRQAAGIAQWTPYDPPALTEGGTDA